MKRAFTLVELLIVIGIIGILSGVLLVSVGGTTESARGAKCMANMRNLAAACQNYGMNTHYFPLAAAVEYASLDESGGIRNVKMRYTDYNPINSACGRAWVTWYSNGAYDSKPASSVASESFHQSPYTAMGANGDAQIYCITNGALWKYVNGNRDTFICPSHVKAAQAKNKKAWWSYEMNGYFGGDVAKEGVNKSESYAGIGFSGLKLADRRILFAELPFDKIDEAPYADTAIQYKSLKAGQDQGITFNHSSGKRKCAHVVYADGHVDKLLAPRGELDDTELMDWLCRGLDISFSGSTYEKLED